MSNQISFVDAYNKLVEHNEQETQKLKQRLSDLERDGERLDWLDKNTK